jgi:YD repeat-containing protein
VPVLLNEYDPLTERLDKTRDAFGRPTDFTHGLDDADVPDNVEVITDRLGNRTVYGFDGRGNVTQTTRFLKLLDGRERPITTTAQYGDGANPDKPTSMTDALGRTTRFTYDANGYPTSVHRRAEQDSFCNVQFERGTFYQSPMR